VRARPVPARGLRAAWTRSEWPTVERLCGPVEVFHGTNFVLPPCGQAAGVLTIHDLTFLTHPETVSAASQAYRELVPRGLRRAAMVLTPSAAVAEQVRDAYRLEADRVAVTPLGVGPEWGTAVPPDAAFRQAYELPGRYLVTVSTLEPRKNLQALVTAYLTWVQERPEAPGLVLVGGAGWGGALRVDGPGRERVVSTGHLGDDDLRRVVAGAAALVFPSLDEGFGLPPLEALACGVPVLASDLAVTREVLGDQATFCDATDLDALVAGLESVVVRPVGTVASRREHAARYTWGRCAAETRAAYAAAVAG
jgi:glycosyltransferase involved in cell wall biosynthesis